LKGIVSISGGKLKLLKTANKKEQEINSFEVGYLPNSFAFYFLALLLFIRVAKFCLYWQYPQKIQSFCQIFL